MSTTYDPALSARLIAEEREDDARMPLTWIVDGFDHPSGATDIRSVECVCGPLHAYGYCPKCDAVAEFVPVEYAACVARTRNNLSDFADQLAAAGCEIARLTAERDDARAEAQAGDQRLACVLDGTFSVGDGTAQQEIERLRAEVDRLNKEAKCPK